MWLVTRSTNQANSRETRDGVTLASLATGESASERISIVVDGRRVSAPRNAYFGDLHMHTRYSVDAYAIPQFRATSKMLSKSYVC